MIDLVAPYITLYYYILYVKQIPQFLKVLKVYDKLYPNTLLNQFAIYH